MLCPMEKATVSSRRGRALLLALVALAGILPFLPNVADPLVSDDFVAIAALADQPLGGVLSGANLAGGTAFRPLTNAVLWVETILFGTTSFYFHAVHLLFGAAAVLALFLFVEALFGRRAGLIAALAFAFAPAHVENLAWISGLGGVLATALLMTALLLHVRARETGHPAVPPVSAVFFGLALLAGEVAIVGPALLLLVDRHLEPRPTRRDTAVVVAGWIAIAVGWIVWRLSVLGGAPHPQFGLFVARDLIRYVQLFFVPAGFDEAIPWVMAHRLPVFGAVGLVGAAVAFFGRGLLARPAVRVGVIGGVLALIPVASFFPRRVHIFLASAWFALAIAGLAEAGLDAASRTLRRAAWAGLTAWLLACLFLASWQSAVWRDASGLAKSVVDDLVAAAQSDPAYLLVLTAPDSLRGAFVMRNGMHQALRLRLPDSKTVVHELLLVGLSTPEGEGLSVRRTNANAFLVRHDGESMNDYLLPPDGSRDMRPDDVRTVGPTGLRAVAQQRPFGLSEIEVSIDPRLLAKKTTVVLGFANGRLTPLAQGDKP
jgi:Dolichyl-phosphate-mannose-protein mannosyltransferase